MYLYLDSLRYLHLVTMEMNNSFPFKVNPLSLPKLMTRGEWRAACKLALELADLWDVVSGDEKQPTTGDVATTENKRT